MDDKNKNNDNFINLFQKLFENINLEDFNEFYNVGENSTHSNKENSEDEGDEVDEDDEDDEEDEEDEEDDEDEEEDEEDDDEESKEDEEGMYDAWANKKCDEECKKKCDEECSDDCDEECSDDCDEECSDDCDEECDEHHPQKNNNKCLICSKNINKNDEVEKKFNFIIHKKCIVNVDNKNIDLDKLLDDISNNFFKK